jgi:ATP-dependent DNA ligase
MNGRFPSLTIPVRPPLSPMEARAVETLPAGSGWQFEPKWDGFRCLAFREARTVVLQSKAGEPLTRYFPEVVMAVANLPEQRFVLDGELVIVRGDGRLSFDDLQERLHPSARKVAQLSARSPATFVVFDLLAEGDDALLDEPLAERRKRLEKFFQRVAAAGGGDGVRLSPVTAKKSEALGWLKSLGPAGVDGVVAKKTAAGYGGGQRDAMVKLKPERTADCVVGGLRRAADGKEIAALLLGLYDDDGRLHYVGAAGGFPDKVRKGLDKAVAPLAGASAFTGTTPTTESRLGHGKSRDWEPLEPRLVCEVRYDRFDEDRFRHVTTFVRWRPDKPPERCTFDQVRPEAPKGARGLELIGL